MNGEIVRDDLASDFGLTEAEFLLLWRHRYLRADGAIWPGVHVGRFAHALTLIRNGQPDRVATNRNS